MVGGKPHDRSITPGSSSFLIQRLGLTLLTSSTGSKISTPRHLHIPSEITNLDSLALDSFAPHKNKGKKSKEKESPNEKEQRLKEEKVQQELRDAFAFISNFFPPAERRAKTINHPVIHAAIFVDQ
jgi:hypothetical protein